MKTSGKVATSEGIFALLYSLSEIKIVLQNCDQCRGFGRKTKNLVAISSPALAFGMVQPFRKAKTLELKKKKKRQQHKAKKQTGIA